MLGITYMQAIAGPKSYKCPSVYESDYFAMVDFMCDKKKNTLPVRPNGSSQSSTLVT
jgi:hypothetical protein